MANMITLLLRLHRVASGAGQPYRQSAVQHETAAQHGQGFGDSTEARLSVRQQSGQPGRVQWTLQPVRMKLRQDAYRKGLLTCVRTYEPKYHVPQTPVIQV